MTGKGGRGNLACQAGERGVRFTFKGINLPEEKRNIHCPIKVPKWKSWVCNFNWLGSIKWEYIVVCLYKGTRESHYVYVCSCGLKRWRCLFKVSATWYDWLQDLLHVEFGKRRACHQTFTPLLQSPTPWWTDYTSEANTIPTLWLITVAF